MSDYNLFYFFHEIVHKLNFFKYLASIFFQSMYRIFDTKHGKLIVSSSIKSYVSTGIKVFLPPSLLARGSRNLKSRKFLLLPFIGHN